MRQMVRQDDKGFYQGHRQNRDHDGRYHRQYMPDIAFQKNQRPEHRHRCGEGQHNARQYFPRAVDHCFQSDVAAPPAGHDVLGNDNGIIHDNPDHHQQTNHGQQVQGIAGDLHHRDGTEQGYRQSSRDPERIAQPEEQPHGEEHQQDALSAILHQHGQPVINNGGHIIDDDDFNAGRQALQLIINKGPNRRDDLQRIIAVTLINVQLCRIPAIEDIAVFVILETVGDGGDITQCDLPAEITADNHQLPEGIRRPAFVSKSQRQNAIPGRDFPRRQIDTLAADHIDNIVDRQTKPAQRDVIQFDPDL